MAVGAFAANRDIYRIGMDVASNDDIGAALGSRDRASDRAAHRRERRHARISSSRARRSTTGPGLDALPMPISTPGWDDAPYLDRDRVITKDPETGIQNLGTYRAQIKSPRRLGMMTLVDLRAGIYAIGKSTRRRASGCRCAIVVGCPPCVAFMAAQKPPRDVDELPSPAALPARRSTSSARKTVDLLVPAEAEIVIEGFIDTDYLEPEAPFGESHGHVTSQEYNAFMEVTAITRRRDAILTSIISQVTPSESSVIKRIGMRAAVPAPSARHARHQGHQARLDARAADHLRKLVIAAVRARGSPRPKSGARCTARRRCRRSPANT